MNKKDLTAKVASKTGLTNVAASRAIDAMFDSLQESLVNGEQTVIQGFGTFSISNRAARNGVNPLTKQPITIPARKAVKFSASKKIVIK